jgi:hypothetical protein
MKKKKKKKHIHVYTKKCFQLIIRISFLNLPTFIHIGLYISFPGVDRCLDGVGTTTPSYHFLQ